MTSFPWQNNSGEIFNERRLKIEGGPGGDHDIKYVYRQPDNLPKLLTLLARVQKGDFQDDLLDMSATDSQPSAE